MRLTDIPALLVEDAVRKWRRRLIAGLVVLAFAIGVVIELVAAARLALEAAAGPIAARLILAGLFLIVIVAAIVLTLRAERRPGKARRPEADERVLVIAEAIDLGYSLARDLTQSKPPTQPKPSEKRAAAANGAAAEGDGPVRQTAPGN